MMIIFLTLLAAFGAWLGGFVAIKSQKRLAAAMALTSGLVLGLVAFDLLPEVFEGIARTGSQAVWPMILFVAGFMSFHAIEKFVVVHRADESSYKPHHHADGGTVRALALAAHSFIDGLSIGVAFQIDQAVGYAVALAVIGHRFADGFDATSFMIFHGNTMVRVRKILFVVAAMPIVGGAVSLLLPFSENFLTLYLGFFAGVLMYIAASNILPQAHAKDRTSRSFLLMVSGVLFMLILSRYV